MTSNNPLEELLMAFAQEAADNAAVHAKQVRGVTDFPGFVDWMFDSPSAGPVDAVAIKQLYSAWAKVA